MKEIILNKEDIISLFKSEQPMKESVISSFLQNSQIGSSNQEEFKRILKGAITSDGSVDDFVFIDRNKKDDKQK